MTKIGLGVFPICLFTAAMLGCGSSAPHPNAPAGAPQKDSASETQARTSADKTHSDSDPKVAEAEQRCANEIEQAELQPPDQLSKIQIAACMYASTDKIRECAGDAPKEVVLKIVIDKDGTVANAFPVGESADSPEAGCVTNVIKDVVFPKFKGQPQQNVKYPFTVGG